MDPLDEQHGDEDLAKELHRTHDIGTGALLGEAWSRPVLGETMAG
jgi:hypothetical protein